MADYVNRSILCQAYIHADVNLTDEQLNKLTRELTNYLQSRGEFFLNQDIDTDVKTKSGSLIVHATIIGSIMTTIALYPGFRAGVISINQDIKRLSEAMVSECQFWSGSKYSSTIRAEARTGIFGTMRVSIYRLEEIKERHGRSTVKSQNLRLQRLAKRLERIIKSIYSIEDLEYVKENMLVIAQDCIPSEPIGSKKTPVAREDRQAYLKSRQIIIRMLEASDDIPF